MIFRSSYRKCHVKKAALKDFAIFTGKRLCWSLFFKKLETFRVATLLKRDFNTVVFEISFEKFLRAPILKSTCQRLLLDFCSVRKSNLCFQYEESMNRKDLMCLQDYVQSYIRLGD